MTYDEAVRALFSLGRELASPQQARVQKFGLGNITTLAEALGNPHRASPCVHIAGTNGKGSTAAMLESVLFNAGFSTGLYTSPHLERINERIRIDGEDISDEAFARAWDRVHTAIESLMASGKLAAHPTFFECITAMAFVAFAEAKIDFAVYEVGLGGRLDATNIVVPELAVITPIDFDHENFLGHSIAEIASEKSGIIKQNAWVVSATPITAPNTTGAIAAEVIAKRATEQNACLFEIDRVWQLDDSDIESASADGFYRATATSKQLEATIHLAPSLAGRFQVRNALTAATAARLLNDKNFKIPTAAIEQGITSARWPGRLERISTQPPVYLDGTHNPAGARELARFWRENFAERPIILVYGAMRDKAVDEIAGQLFPLAHTVILTQPRQPRAISANLLAEMTAGLAAKSLIVPDPREALERAMQGAVELGNAPPSVSSAKGPAVFATGSLFLVGDLRAYWPHRTPAK
ncbi:MAG: folylpolyglutamate synthase/dihydrofolate synthase family protein [Candidatus Acidiferrales bacterium]